MTIHGKMTFYNQIVLLDDGENYKTVTDQTVTGVHEEDGHMIGYWQKTYVGLDDDTQEWHEL